jgi:formamidopyrimidine-DNA glycosylase
MPELPEVETIVGDLNQKVAGCYVSGFWSDWEKALGPEMSAKKLDQELKGDRIKEFSRRGKNILMHLESGRVVWIHLKMTGHLLVKPQAKTEFGSRQARNQNRGGQGSKVGSGGADQLRNKKGRERVQVTNLNQPQEIRQEDYFAERVNQYIHHIWYLNEVVQPLKREGAAMKGGSAAPGQQKKLDKDFGLTLEFSDLRKFGKIRLFESYSEAEEKVLSELGLEPLSKGFTFAKFKNALRKNNKKNIRNFLLEQGGLAGVGNIYASEILFDSGVSPKRIIGGLSEEEIKKIFQATKRILRKAVKYRGTSDSDYRDTRGAPGRFQDHLKVYNREGEKCPRKGCQGVVKREKVNQRSAFWCEECQR